MKLSEEVAFQRQAAARASQLQRRGEDVFDAVRRAGMWLSVSVGAGVAGGLWWASTAKSVDGAPNMWGLICWFLVAFVGGVAASMAVHLLVLAGLQMVGRVSRWRVNGWLGKARRSRDALQAGLSVSELFAAMWDVAAAPLDADDRADLSMVLDTAYELVQRNTDPGCKLDTATAERVREAVGAVCGVVAAARREAELRAAVKKPVLFPDEVTAAYLDEDVERLRERFGLPAGTSTPTEKSVSPG